MSNFEKLPTGVGDPQPGVSSPISGLAESVIGPLIGKFQQSEKPLFPELAQAFGGLFKSISAGQRFDCPSTPLPFSPAASGIPPGFSNSPSELQGLLADASQKLSLAMSQAAQRPGPGGSPSESAAQQSLKNLENAVHQASSLMNIHGHGRKQDIEDPAKR